MVQKKPKKRATSAGAFNYVEFLQMVKIWEENTPEGLQKKFFHIVSYELDWRGGKAVNYLLEFFTEDRSNRVKCRV